MKQALNIFILLFVLAGLMSACKKDGNPAKSRTELLTAGNWKLIEYYETTLTGQGAPLELFNLADDPAEKTNLAERDPKRVAALKARLAEWRKKVGAQMPTVNPKYDPAKVKQKP